MALLLALGAPARFPSLPRWTTESTPEAPGQQAVVLGWATRGCAEHTLGGTYCSLPETTPGDPKKPWLLEVPGSLPGKILEIPASLLYSHSSRTCYHICDWSSHSLILTVPFGVTQNAPFSPTLIHSFTHSSIHSFFHLIHAECLL